jgi:hypothetical protein
MTLTNTRLGGLLAAAGLACAALLAAPAQAATCTTANLTTSTACLAGIPGGPGGNATTTQMNGFNAGAGVFGVNSWLDLGKIDTTKEPGSFASAFFTVTTTAGNASGTWSLNPGLKFAPGASYAFVLKGAQSNVAYLLDTTAQSGTWTNLDLFTPNGRNNAGLSNMTLYGTATPAPVPLPAAAWLLIAGMAGLGAVARKRRNAAA